MASTQKALLVTEISKPMVLVTDYPIPQPGPDQIQLKVSVAGLNPHDQKARDWGLFIKDHLPASLTNDIVGTVTKLGSAIPDGVVSVGDRVVSHGGFGDKINQNGLQEYAIADIGAFARVPDSISNDEAATLPTNIIAPLVALFVSLEIPAPWTEAAKDFDYAGMTLLVLGGGSNCGKFGVQLAKLAGIGRIVVVGGPEQELESYGATHILDRHGGYDIVLKHIRDVVGDELVYAYDAINLPEDQPLGLNALSSTKKGLFARLRAMSPVDETKVVGKKAGFEVRNVFGSSQAHPELSRGFWERVPAWLEEGKIKPPPFVVKEGGLRQEMVNEVLDAYRAGIPVTKTHIHL